MGSTSPAVPTPAVSITKHPATLPTATIANDVNTSEIAHVGLVKLANLSNEDVADNVIWRDSLAFSGTFRTFHTPEVMLRNWHKLLKYQKAGEFVVFPGSAKVFRLAVETSWVEADFAFDTHGSLPSRCSGKIGLVPEDGRWKIWLLCTTLEQPHGFPDVDHLVPGPSPLPQNDCYDCIVVGGGMAGLHMAGRLKALGLSYIVIDKHAAIGDVWTEDRYDSVKLHTSRCYNQMPGTPKMFRPEHPYLLSGQNLKRGFQEYVDVFGINVMLSTIVQRAIWDPSTQTWSISAHDTSSSNTTLSMQSRHLILATGNNGTIPVTPSYQHPQRFKGDILHSSKWRNASPWSGKKGIVIGAANSAHDVIADMARSNLKSITLVQRGETFVLPLSTFSAIVDPVFNDDVPTEVSDWILLSYPLPIQRLVAMRAIRACADEKPELFDAMEARGFKTIRYGDLWGLLFDREGGHFFDVGAGQLIRDGVVEVKSDALPVSYTETGLAFSDGSKIDADVIVLATGYVGDGIKQTARTILGEEVAAKLQEFWQCDEEGEMRGAWKHVGHPNLWYTGHGYAHARYHSRFVALHIKADVEGKPMHPYTAT